MIYYELYNDDHSVIGIASSYEARKYQAKHNLLVVSKDIEAEYLDVNGVLYRDFWFRPVRSVEYPYTLCNIMVITKDEYDALAEAIDNGEQASLIIEEPEPEAAEEPTQTDENAEMNLEYVKSMKIKEMSATCQNAITNGFDIVLSDENTYHFSLTIQDQLNMLGLSVMVANGVEQIPYHADGELCKEFPVADFIAISTMANTHKTYHVTYYNSLKNYINSLDDISDVNSVTYGMAIPVEFQSEVLKEFISNATESV